MKLTPEYLILLPSSPSSSQKSLSDPSLMPSPTGKGNLFTVKRIILVLSVLQHQMLFNSVLLFLTQDQQIGGSCWGILMWSLSVWENYSQRKEVSKLLSSPWTLIINHLVFYSVLLAYNDDACILPVQTTQGEPTFCSQCGSVLDCTYDNMVIIY